jgi:rhodanese-related sulfurtransferase
MTFRKSAAVKYFEAKVAFSAGPSELDHMIKEGEDVNIIDVRRREDYLKGHVPHAVNLPKEQWEALNGLDMNKLNVVYCYTQQCHAATNACLLFARKGYPVKELEGGWKAWQEYGLATEAGETTQRKAA